MFLNRHKLAAALGLLLAVGLVWIVVSVRRNEARKLDLARLQSAQALWKSQGPASYRLEYSIRRSNSTQPDRYEVQVVDGKAVAARVNDKEEDASRLYHYGMEKLFAYLERFLEIDSKAASGQVIHRADFGSSDGRLLRYNRQVPGKREGVEIVVQSVE